MSQPKALFVAPLRDFSGYASVSRDYARALNNAGLTIVTRDLIYDNGQYKRNSAECTWADNNTQGVNIVIQQTTPNEMEPKAGCFNVGIFCWETDRIPDLWVNQLNKMDLILVPCEDNLLVARKCGVITPVEKVPYSCTINKYEKSLVPFITPGAEDAFKFLAVCQYSKKKGIDPLLKAYLSEFGEYDNALLILKTYFGPNDGEAEAKKMHEILNVIKRALRLKKYPRIQLIHEVMSFDDIERLHATADCYCLPSRGEGWGVPHFDALDYGLPVIATKGTGPEEFITPECGWLVDSHMSPCIDMPHPHDFMYTAQDNWREPQVCALKRAMREAYELWKRRDDSDAWSKMCLAAKERVKDFSNDIVGPQLRDVIMKYYEMWRVTCS
ncbi:glycosyltransferase [Candidatus Bathyarchaeota archaeon]|nr:MAG: glycosyltransferase [Candidatus Bathyarchaeota archaeon]